MPACREVDRRLAATSMSWRNCCERIPGTMPLPIVSSGSRLFVGCGQALIGVKRIPTGLLLARQRELSQIQLTAQGARGAWSIRISASVVGRIPEPAYFREGP